MGITNHLVSRLWRLLVLVNDTIDRIRVELHGAYGHDRLHELAAYLQRPQINIRAALVALVMPLPCFITLVAVDALPLAPIQSGIANQTASFWLRTAFGGSIMASAAFFTMVQSVPTLVMSSMRLLLIGPVIGFAALPTIYLLIKLVGFPLPFTLMANAPSWSNLMVAATLLNWKDTLRTNKKTREDLLRVLITFSALFTIVSVYTGFSYLFNTLNASMQNVVSCLLPFVKLAFKNWVNAGLHHSPHIKPIYSVFTLDLFHAMFISTAMQQNVAGSALLIVLGVDIVLSVIAVNEVSTVARCVRKAMNESNRIHRQTQTSLSLRRKAQAAVIHGPIAYAIHVLETNEHVHRHIGLEGSNLSEMLDGGAQPCGGQFGNESNPGPTLPILRQAINPRIVPVVGNIDNSPAPQSGRVDPELTITKMTLKMLYMMEFYVLTEYAEAIVAFIYGSYLYTLSFLPNRVYYPQLAMLTPDELREKAMRVLVYGALEMLSLVVFCVVLGRVVGNCSPIGQLGFVLEKHWWLLQTLLVNWITFVVLSTVQHLGADYTFQFKWLKQHQDGTT